LIASLLGLLTAVLLDVATSNMLTGGDGWSHPGSIVGVACVLIGGLLGTWKTPDRLSIIRSDEHVSGPNGKWWGWGRVELPLDKLDLERTCRQTVLQRLFGYRYLWSTDGQKIRISYWEFAPAQVAALLEELGCSAGER
jgi:hypothetical protein